MRVSSMKAKARRLQNGVVEALKEAWGMTEDDVKPALMGEKGKDILLLSERARNVFPFSTECKNTERLQIWDALKQAESNRGDLIPLLVFTRNRHKTYAILEFSVLIGLLKLVNPEFSDVRQPPPETHLPGSSKNGIPGGSEGA
jgi:hypothetical protein